VRRETQHVLLVLLGGALLRIAADDTHLRYVRPAHRWLLLGAGAVVVVLAVVALVRDRRGGAVAAESHDHGGGRHAPWLLLAPVLVIALVAPPALGADAVVRAGAGNAVIGAADAFPPLPDGAALTVAEVVRRAAWDTSGSLDGREVELTGFVVRRGAAVELARLTIACCAADARAHRVRLVGADELGDPPPDTWLRVRGRVQSGSATAATGRVPALTVTSAEVVTAPPDPYEY
jgi:uncharacterized repeat protein (TIGR03943 family)